MSQINFHGDVQAGPFGHRKLTPRACVIDSKKHLRLFLSDALEDLGFVTSECGQASDLASVIDIHQPDLLVLSVCANGVEPGDILETVVRKNFTGKLCAATESRIAIDVDGTVTELDLSIVDKARLVPNL